jgi:hypothetical protein
MAYKIPATSGVSSGNLVLIESQVISVAQAAVEFKTNVTGYDVYHLIYYDLTCTALAANLLYRFSTDGGSSYDSGGNYQNSGYAAVAGGGLSRIGGGGETNGILVYALDGGPTCGDANFFLLSVNGSNKGVISNWVSNASGIGFMNGQQACTYQNTSVVNAFEIFPTSGNITGTFKLYGVQD